MDAQTSVPIKQTWQTLRAGVKLVKTMVALSELVAARPGFRGWFWIRSTRSRDRTNPREFVSSI